MVFLDIRSRSCVPQIEDALRQMEVFQCLSLLHHCMETVGVAPPGMSGSTGAAASSSRPPPAGASNEMFHASNNPKVVQARQSPRSSQEFKYFGQDDEFSDLSDSPFGGRSGWCSGGRSSLGGSGGADDKDAAAPPRKRRTAAAVGAKSNSTQTKKADPQKRDGRAGKKKYPLEDWEDMLMVQCAMKFKYEDEVRSGIHLLTVCTFLGTLASLGTIRSVHWYGTHI